jgi:2-oxoglutarate ferredoxin oxidoreductase subunit delta
MNKLTFQEELCKGCQLCVDVCPKKILKLNDEYVNPKGFNPISCTDMSACTACALCARICPDSVIKVEKDVA